MKLTNIAIAAVAVIALVVLAAVGSMAFVFMDAMSYTATGSETSSPAGNVTGKALVVYNPGITGGAANAAATIAGMLKDRGYEVTLAGIKSAAAYETSGYDVIIVGGPIYGASASPSVQSYLAALKPDAGAKAGVFGTGGGAPEADTPEGILKEVASLPDGSPLTVKASMKLWGDDNDRRCAAFLDELLKRYG